MNNKRIQQTISSIFLLVTISVVALTGTASGQQKNLTTQLNNPTNKAVVYARGTSYYGDSEVKCDLKVEDLLAMGIIPVAVNPRLVPYGSEIKILNADGSEKITYGPKGQRMTYLALDDGPDVYRRKAAIELAAKKGLSPKSPEAKAQVLDFYAPSDVTTEWAHFEINYYQGAPFDKLKYAQKLAFIQQVRRDISLVMK